MAKKKAVETETKELTPRQQEMAEIRKIPRPDRDKETVARLQSLVKEENRERFVNLHAKRVKNARKALRNVARMGDTNNYSYDPEEAAEIVRVLSADLEGIKRAFKSGEKEAGKYDI